MQQEWIDKARDLAQSRLLERAADYDREPRFPTEDFADLHAAGLLAPLVPRAYGGLGLGHHRGDILTHWLIAIELARADMSLARCFEGHANAQLLLDNMGTPEQQARWFDGMVNHGQIWSCWSGEPQKRKPGQTQRFGTHVSEEADGYRITGSKAFCSSAPGADWAILFVSTAGPGGARHIDASPESLIMLACDLSDPSVSLDDSWWEPIGMKASVSYLVHFQDTWIPRANLIGYPGQYLLEDWQTRLTPQYAATFLGGAQAAYDETVQYVRARDLTEDPYIHHRIGKMGLNLRTCYGWLEQTARLWETDQLETAKLHSVGTRYIVEQLAVEIVQHAIHVCGARSLIRPSRLERIYRDLSFYVRHDNDDQVLATFGRHLLGASHDLSFFG